MTTTTRMTLLLCAGVLPACGSTPDSKLGPAIMMQPEATAPTPSTTPSAATAPGAKWINLEASPGVAELEPGASAIQREDWTAARASLEPAVEQIRGSAPLDSVLAGEALLGRACNKMDDKACAETHYRAILGAWKGAETARAITDAAGPDAASKQAHLERALLAVGEAHFFTGDQKRAAADLVRVPVYQGDGSSESVKEFVATKVAPWLKERETAVRDAESEYAEIAALEPTPPPRWAVPASARTAQLWGKFTAELRAAPIPLTWAKNSGPVPGTTTTYLELRKSFYGAMDEASVPLQKVTRTAFKKCQSDASRFGYADEYSKTCNQWLEKMQIK